MWVCKNFEMVNLYNIDSIEMNICEDDDQFELDFVKNDKVIGFFFFENKEELERTFENIVNGLRNNIKFLNI